MCVLDKNIYIYIHSLTHTHMRSFKRTSTVPNNSDKKRFGNLGSRSLDPRRACVVNYPSIPTSRSPPVSSRESSTGLGCGVWV